jgi:Transposase DNA-binding/Transposase Tn5 dimerisation domain
MIAPWAMDEAGTAKFGDKRLKARFGVLLSSLGNRPNLSIPAACEGRAEMEAAYRFFDNDKVTFEKVLKPHCDKTLQRLAGQSVALLVQDTTEIDVTRPEQVVQGAGELDGARRGFLMHLLEAFTPDGTPLGAVWAEIINRTEGVSHAPAAEKRSTNKSKPIEEKESFRWLKGLREAREAAEKLPGVQCVCIGDSESDIYEVLAEERQSLHLLVRACQDRALQDETGLHVREQVLTTPVLTTANLQIRGRKAKTAAETRGRRQSRESRKAVVEVRAARVTLRPPPRPDRKLPPVTVNVIVVSEVNPPVGEPAVEWILLTTLPIDTLEQVQLIVSYYCVRWQIEILFRTLKSGCRIEQRRFEQVDRLTSCLGLYLIVAWRTMFVCHLGRECPDVDCDVIFEPSEWKAVWMATHNEELPQTPPSLKTMVHLIAQMGGYVERPESEPGPQTMWIGMQRMYDLSLAWDKFGPGAKLRRR